MVFEALVVETDTFFERGTIVVRIPSLYFRKMNWDLSEDYPNFLEDGLDGDERKYDFEAYVYSPYGGGSNFGTFFLPQVNQRGIVLSMDKHFKQLIWLGSFFMPTRNDDFTIKNVNIPTDDMMKEGEEGYGVLDGEQNMLAEDLAGAKAKNFVARFKTTDKSSAEGLTWEDRPTSNIISIGDNSFFVTHFPKDTGWEEKEPKFWTTFSMSKDEEENDLTELKRVDVEKTLEQRIALATIEEKESIAVEVKEGEEGEKLGQVILNNESITAQVKEEEAIGKVVLTKDGINIMIDKEGEIYSLNLSSEEGILKIEVNENIITLDKEGKLVVDIEGETIINSGDITIEPDGDITVNMDGNINVTAGDVTIEPDGKVMIGKSNRSALVRFNEMEKIVNKLEKHIHVAPTGPTTAPVESSLTPIPPTIMQDKRNMKTKKVEAE